MLLLLAPTALALPLLVERFDANALPEGWKTSVAVQNGGGKPSELTFDSGALVLTAGAKTKKFTAVHKDLELRGVRWIRVQARVKAEGVTTTEVCGVFVRFDVGAGLTEMAPAGPCGAGDWSTTERYFAVPDGARGVNVGFLLPAAGVARLDELIVEPVTPDWKDLGRGSFNYHWIGNDSFREEQLVANDEALDRAAALLGAAPSGKIKYIKHANLDTIEQWTGVRADRVVRPGEVHTTVRTDAHGILQALAGAWGDPPPLLAEGLAVSFVGEWGGRDLRQASRGLATAGKAPTLATLLDPNQFGALPADETRPVAGAFVAWVTATKGADTVKALYGATKAGASVADNTKAMESVLGMKLADADTALRAWW
jgi:hypothetical protein